MGNPFFKISGYKEYEAMESMAYRFKLFWKNGDRWDFIMHVEESGHGGPMDFLDEIGRNIIHREMSDETEWTSNAGRSFEKWRQTLPVEERDYGLPPARVGLPEIAGNMATSLAQRKEQFKWIRSSVVFSLPSDDPGAFRTFKGKWEGNLIEHVNRKYPDATVLNQIHIGRKPSEFYWSECCPYKDEVEA